MSGIITQRPPPRAKCELLVYRRDELQHVPLVPGSVLEIGRIASNTLQLDDPLVSRHHARLHVGADGVEVEDLGSANGTLLVRGGEGQRPSEDTHSGTHERLGPHERTAMRPGDALRIASNILVLQYKKGSSSELKSVSGTTAPVLVDAEMRRIYQLAARAAASDIPVLILGETGVGKEVMAETIHRRSRRAERPFLKLNCAALTESLLESELFGHERGAFTGAQAAKVGLLESNDSGTVFLDEIGELPLGTQAKLLRVLEEGSVIRVGATKPKKVDVRFVTATNRELGREVRAHRFRGDLYYRVSGVVLQIPPLRNRKDEIEPLARHFLREFCARTGQHEPELSTAVLDFLRVHDWPGNVRELRNVMQRSVLVCTEGRLAPEHILLESSGFDSLVPAERELADFDDDEAVTKVTSGDPILANLDGDERGRILNALELCGGNQTRAAKLLNMSRRTLINRVEKFNLPRPKKT